MEKNNLVLISAGFLVGLVAGAGLFFVFAGQPSEEHEALRQAVRDQYPEYFEDSELGTSYSGVVQEVKSNSILIRVEIPEVLLLASDLKETIEVKIDENTRIIKIVSKDEAEYAQELAQYDEALIEYQAQVDALPPGTSEEEIMEIAFPIFPEPTRTDELALNEVEVGVSISVSIQQAEALGGTEEPGEVTTLITVQEDIEELEVLAE